ncbi:hypothetical protein LJC63_10880 [Ruminococcaceae bacterium OttesenSCG-928-L11]|nr:hypothetical protein [Ruminococcaceae bacterium OttesenSCG-928-L11]
MANNGITKSVSDKALMTMCVLGLHRHMKELKLNQGDEASAEILALSDLAEEITNFWNLDGDIS